MLYRYVGTVIYVKPVAKAECVCRFELFKLNVVIHLKAAAEFVHRNPPWT